MSSTSGKIATPTKYCCRWVWGFIYQSDNISNIFTNTGCHLSSFNSKAAASSFSFYSLSCNADKCFKQPLLLQPLMENSCILSVHHNVFLLSMCTCYTMSTVLPGGCQQRDLVHVESLTNCGPLTCTLICESKRLSKQLILSPPKQKTTFNFQ